MFQSYSNALTELSIAHKRLNYLQERKEDLFTMYCMPKAIQVDLIGGQHQPTYTDKVNAYVVAINSPQSVNGLSINEEIEQLTKRINHLTLLLQQMTKQLVDLKGIECELFVEIMINGSRVSDAIKIVAAQHYMSQSNIWHNYYPKVKEYIGKVKQVKQ